MSKKRKIISYILSLALVISISASVLLCVVNINLLNVSNMKKKLSENNYYESVYNIITDACDNYIMQSGFDSTVLVDVFSKEDVETDVNGIIEYIYEGKEYNIQTEMLKIKLDQNIQNFIAQNNYIVSEENQKSIDDFEETIRDTYKKNIEYSNETVKLITKYVKIAKKATGIIIVIMYVVVAVLAYIVYKVNRPSIGISMVSVGILCIFVNCYSGVNVAVNNILILSKPFSNVLTSTANNILHTLFVIGIIFCIAGVGLILRFELSKKIVKMSLIEEHSQIIR